MFCTQCGRPAVTGASFCTGCGTAYGSTSGRYAAEAGVPARPLEPAGFGLRLGGYLIDYFLGTIGGIVIGIVFLIAFLPPNATREEEDGVTTAASLVALLGWFLYKWISDSLGGTVGKLVMGLRVVDHNHYRPIGFGAGFLRTLVSILSSLPLGLGFLWAAWDKNRQTWHDKAAGTLVVRHRDLARLTPAPGALAETPAEP